MNFSQLLKTYRNEILQLAEKHGALNVRVFGSVANQTTGADSDLDLLVDMGPDRSFFFPAGLVVDLEELLGIHVDVVTPNGLKPNIREQVLKEARPL